MRGRHSTGPLTVVVVGVQVTVAAQHRSKQGSTHEPIEHNADHECVKLCVPNVRSVDCIVDFVVDDDLDILCLTETWLQSKDTASATTVTSWGYLFEHVARSNVSKLHNLLITPNYDPLHPLNASIYKYALTGSPLVRLSSKGQRVTTLNQSSL